MQFRLDNRGPTGEERKKKHTNYGFTEVCCIPRLLIDSTDQNIEFIDKWFFRQDTRQELAGWDKVEEKHIWNAGGVETRITESIQLKPARISLCQTC